MSDSGTSPDFKVLTAGITKLNGQNVDMQKDAQKRHAAFARTANLDSIEASAGTTKTGMDVLKVAFIASTTTPPADASTTTATAEDGSSA